MDCALKGGPGAARGATQARVDQTGLQTLRPGVTGLLVQGRHVPRPVGAALSHGQDEVLV